jgi:hypothetical protein
MHLLSGEKILLESDPKGLILTTHRVQSEVKVFGGDEVISIMLDELASCAITRTSNPIPLILAALCLVIGFMVMTNSRGDATPLITWGIIALIFFGVYYATRRQVIALASSGATIQRSIKGMTLQTAKQFINTVEAAKNERYLLGKKA